MLSGPRLRQVALVAADCGQVAGELRRAFGWLPPFHDPGVGEFGLTNAVFAVGDTFVEVVAPARPGTTAGRYLDRRGGDGGYMAIFQVQDIAAARRRVAGLGVRVIWTADLPDIAGTHLHPRDVPGAIVSLDSALPEQSWRWAGPSWTGQVPSYRPGGVTGLTIEVGDPAAAAARWAQVLGIGPADGQAEAGGRADVDGRAEAGGPAEAGGRADVDGRAEAGGRAVVVALADSGQWLRFVPARGGHGEGITEVTIAGLPAGGPWLIGGVRFAGAEG